MFILLEWPPGYGISISAAKEITCDMAITYPEPQGGYVPSILMSLTSTKLSSPALYQEI